MTSTAPPASSSPSVTGAYLRVLLAGVLWGAAGIFSVALYRLGIPASSVAFLRTAAGAVVLSLFLLPRGAQAFRLSGRDALIFVGLGGSLVGLFQLSYQFSTASVGVPATTALLYLAPAWVVAASALFFGERLTRNRVILVLVSVTGVWLAVFGARGVDVSLTGAGLFWGCLTGFTYGNYTLFAKALTPRKGALPSLFWMTLGATLFLLLRALIGRDPIFFPTSWGGWGLLAAFGFFTMALAPLFLFQALKTLEAGRAAIGTTVEPLVATLLAVALLDQSLTGGGWAGLVLLLVGVAGAYAIRSPRPPGTSTLTSAPPDS
jgi:drug/metabolite transporter, DME family